MFSTTTVAPARPRQFAVIGDLREYFASSASAEEKVAAAAAFLARRAADGPFWAKNRAMIARILDLVEENGGDAFGLLTDITPATDEVAEKLTELADALARDIVRALTAP